MSTIKVTILSEAIIEREPKDLQVIKAEPGSMCDGMFFLHELDNDHMWQISKKVYWETKSILNPDDVDAWEENKRISKK